MRYIINTFRAFPIPYPYLFIGAGIGILIDLLQNFTWHLSMRNDYDFSWFTVSSRFFAFYLAWVLLAPFIYRVALVHADIFQVSQKKKLIRWIGLGLLISLVHLLLYSLTFDLIMYFKNGVFPDWLQINLLIRIGANYFASLVYYLLITAIFFFHIYLFRYLQKEKELNRAKLNALLMQLRPHFLFNTLHSINTLIDLDARAAQRMVTKLGELLRQVIQSEQGHLITFEEELSFIKNYLDIEQVRFQDRLQIHYHIAPDSLPAKIPRLLLQPIAENAIKHGISKLTDHGSVSISSSVQKTAYPPKAYLQIHIKDNGPGFESGSVLNSNKGIGLNNVILRLKQHYQDDFVFDIDSEPETGGAHIYLKIPLGTK